MKPGYEPSSFEKKIYADWETQGAFRAQDESSKPSFVIPMPPPNVTGALHNGHALFVTLQDVLCRWKRMRGYNALWMPGMDHAGIATQMVVEKSLSAQGIKKNEIGRDAFLKHVWNWKEKHGGIILEQMKSLGASADWERSRFTMDEGLSRAVRKVFVSLYQDGLIYRGSRITNRCVRCETALSDLEVLSKERKSSLWQIKYLSVDKKHHLTVATTRPETLLGDTALAVHPEDERYEQLRKLKFTVPLVHREIPVIADAYVEKSFGTGVLKVTPGHDFNDYELGKRHGLPAIHLVLPNGKLSGEGGPYAGLTTHEARKKIVQDLIAEDLLVKEEEITQQVALCQRCESVVEPMMSDQWFVKAEPLAKKVLAAARKGEGIPLSAIDDHDDAFKIVPESWLSTFYHWMENIRDWCISRQLWWGHQVPAWHCQKCPQISVSEEPIIKCLHCGSSEIKQDEDVLDTWFSSALWPFATLGWPEKTSAYQSFYPASVLETGFDILFFWVARMLMFGMHFNDGKVPFHRVYLHAMVRDEKGQKMSKTKGNVIDPLDLVNEYGADAFRITLLSMSGQGRDIKLSLDRVATYRAFCTKLWNASRFTLLKMGILSAPELDGFSAAVPGFHLKNLLLKTSCKSIDDWISHTHSSLHPVNRWILSRFYTTAQRVNCALDEFRMNEATDDLYAFVWYDFCDWYIEFTKEMFKNSSLAEETLAVTGYVLTRILHLAHPFIPFITEEIMRQIPHDSLFRTDSLISSPYPGAGSDNRFREVRHPLIDSESEEAVALWKQAIDSLRNFRGENSIPPKARPSVTFKKSAGGNAQVELGLDLIRALAQLGSLEAEQGALAGQPTTAELVTPIATFYIPLKGLVNVAEELKRLSKKRENSENDAQHIRNKLSKEEFRAKAPPALVEKETQKLLELQKEIQELGTQMEKLKALE